MKIFDWFWKRSKKILVVPECTNSTDYDLVLLHAAFTVLNEFIEKELGGLKNAETEWKNLLRQESAIRGTIDAETAYRALCVMILIMKWYQGVDWNNPVPWAPSSDGQSALRRLAEERNFLKLCQKRLHQLIKVRPYMWTSKIEDET